MIYLIRNFTAYMDIKYAGSSIFLYIFPAHPASNKLRIIGLVFDQKVLRIKSSECFYYLYFTLFIIYNLLFFK
jgi:hypothetical protein